MKKLIIIPICITLLFTGCSLENDSNSNLPVIEDEIYVKSIWITYYELSNYTKNSDEKSFTKSIKFLFKELKDYGFNTVTVQVRPCADAFYNSTIFPVSEYYKGKQGSALEYDPLSIMCEIASELNLYLEAWINPYRVSQNDILDKLCDENIAKKWIKQGSNRVIKVNKKYYFNPSYDEVTKLIVDGVCEIVKNYNIKAIHFDDYFYPSTNKAIDKMEYEQYKKHKGKLSLADWRRENVNSMLKQVYSAIKKINNDVQFGISPASNIENDKNNLYADVEKWVSEQGYIDYICPQIYFGFKNIYQPFMQTTKKWVKMCDEQTLYIGLPLYKAGNLDDYAAENDKNIMNEFVKFDNIIARQIKYISHFDEIKGYYIFSLSSLYSEKSKNEVSNMFSIMQNSNLP